MLSEKRKELLRKNKDKIAAYKANSDGFTVDSLKRFYPDGTFCAGIACLTDEEMEEAKGKNESSILEFCNTHDFSTDDSNTMDKLEDLHDEVVDDGIGFDRFDNYVKEILEN